MSENGCCTVSKRTKVFDWVHAQKTSDSDKHPAVAFLRLQKTTQMLSFVLLSGLIAYSGRALGTGGDFSFHAQLPIVFTVHVAVIVAIYRR